MPAVPGRSGRNVIQNYTTLVGRMSGPNTEAAMAMVLSIGVTGAKELAPLEYGALMNSAYRRIENTAAGIRGVAGFSVFYSIYLHQNTTWRPRPVTMKSGPSWNPNAEPRFLERGFTDPIQRSLMQRALGSAYRL